MSVQPGGEVIVYQRDDAPAIDVRLNGDNEQPPEVETVFLETEKKAQKKIEGKS